MNNGYHSEYAGPRAALSFIYKVYAWMAAGLTLTAATAYYIYSQDALFRMFMQSGWSIGILVAQILLVIAFVGLIHRMSFPVALTVFTLYAISLGISLSCIFHIYQLGSIYSIFGITAGMFAVMALYGYYTKADLTSVGNIMLMGLIGIIIAGLINIFLKSPAMQYAISFIGVLVFAGLTAYDVQKIKQMGQEMLYHQQPVNKIALLGALTLYLNFINMFLFLLQLLGKRKD